MKLLLAVVILTLLWVELLTQANSAAPFTRRQRINQSNRSGMLQTIDWSVDEPIDTGVAAARSWSWSSPMTGIAALPHSHSHQSKLDGWLLSVGSNPPTNEWLSSTTLGFNKPPQTISWSWRTGRVKRAAMHHSTARFSGFYHPTILFRAVSLSDRSGKAEHRKAWKTIG